ncbi:hypothetical protein ABZ669_38335 [Streptomyces hirsutus]|uniref:hypothetical protein n=1 Tax=Streptomyces hirsutus TaxID=35620 RepID=UPI0033E1317B
MLLRYGYRCDGKTEGAHDLGLHGGDNGSGLLLEVEVGQGNGEEVDATGELEVLELVQNLQR